MIDDDQHSTSDSDEFATRCCTSNDNNHETEGLGSSRVSADSQSSQIVKTSGESESEDEFEEGFEERNFSQNTTGNASSVATDNDEDSCHIENVDNAKAADDYDDGDDDGDDDDEDDLDDDSDNVVDEDNDNNSEDNDSDNIGEDDDDNNSEGYDNANENVNNMDENVDVDPLLYDNAAITLSESMLSIFTYTIRHNLTGCAFSDLLSLISLHLPPNSHHKKTIHTFMKFFSDSKAPLIKHYYCSACMKSLDTKDSLCPCTNDININLDNFHGNDSTKNRRPEILYFIEIPIFCQMQELLLQPEFVEALSHPYRRIKEQDNYIEDIYDGILHKQHVAEFNPLSDIFNITFMWYTDGAPVFKSRTYSVWPFYFIINELPYKKRISKENIIVAGLWFGPSDPAVNSFLKPIYYQMVEFHTGVNFRIPGSDQLQLVKASLICGTCDALARSDFLCHNRFNGNYGCSRCLSKGYTIREDGVFGNTHIYPFEGILIARDIADYDNYVSAAKKSKSAVFGVKSSSILNQIMPDMIRGTSIDIMHCVYLGVTKLLAKLWFDSSYRHKPWSLYAHRDVIDERPKKLSHQVL